jgi:hypothetical protein
MDLTMKIATGGQNRGILPQDRPEEVGGEMKLYLTAGRWILCRAICGVQSESPNKQLVFHQLLPYGRNNVMSTFGNSLLSFHQLEVIMPYFKEISNPNRVHRLKRAVV